MNISNDYKNKYFLLLEDEKCKLLLSLIKKEIPENEIYIKRLFKEIKLIIQFNFTEVFLQVSMILELTKGIPHIIRGSAGSCLLCYL